MGIASQRKKYRVNQLQKPEADAQIPYFGDIDIEIDPSKMAVDFHEGDELAYFSNTEKAWIHAIVLKVLVGDNGRQYRVMRVHDKKFRVLRPGRHRMYGVRRKK
jgi:hypothetical protein